MLKSLSQAKPKIRAALKAGPEVVFKEAQLRDLLAQHREAWEFDKGLKLADFIEYLVATKDLQKVELRSEKYKTVVRYALRKYSPYLMALSIRPRSYLSHGTAVFLHALNDQLPKTIYANQEQTPKPSSYGGELTQDRLNLAFSRRQRTSSYVYSLEGGYRIVLLSGKQTGDLGVKAAQGPNGELLPVTGIARTLIDIAVRPAYAGGIVQVLEAYRGAKGRVGAKEIVQTYQKLDYLYPYHQAIGFLMERAGFAAKEYRQLAKLGTPFDFYLVHGMKKTSFDEKWRLFFPEGL